MKAILGQNMVHASSGANFLGNAIGGIGQTIARHRNRVLDEDSRLRIAQGISDMGTARDANAAINRMTVEATKQHLEHHYKVATSKDVLRANTDEGVHRTNLLKSGELSHLVGGGLIQGQMGAPAFYESKIVQDQLAKNIKPRGKASPSPEGDITSHAGGQQGWTQQTFDDVPKSGPLGTPNLLNKVIGRDPVNKTILGSPSSKRRIDEFGEAGNL